MFTLFTTENFKSAERQTRRKSIALKESPENTSKKKNTSSSLEKKMLYFFFEKLRRETKES